MARDRVPLDVRFDAPLTHLAVCRGTDLAPAPYAPGARVPTPPWRRLSAAEYGALTAGVPHVRLVADAWNLRELDARLGVRPLDFRVTRLPAGAGVRTVTVDEHRRPIGLHVDRWTDLPMRRAWEAPWRVTVNLGPGTRWFYVVGVSVVRMAARAGLPPDANGSATALARAFLAEHAELPVYAVEQPPGFAYLAPTDALCHDASTLGAALPSEVLSYLVHARG